MTKFILFLSILSAVYCKFSFAVDSVNPSGVNVNANSVTSVLLTYRGTASQQTSNAFWCGEITVAANTVTPTNPCVPGTFFGRLPQRLQQGQFSRVLQAPDEILGENDLSIPVNQPAQLLGQNFTDIMTIPESVSRKALISARAGNKSSFFYIREFVSNGVKQYIAVTCRLSGHGARVPFALRRVEPYFATSNGPQAVFLQSIGDALPAVNALISYNGSGRLKGRWELVMPADEVPSTFDLVPEANLPIEQRALQKRYRVLARFDKYLPPLGEFLLEGPRPEIFPTDIVGPFQLLLRIEATRDKEGNSDTGNGIVFSGGVSGFDIPALRYYVAQQDEVIQAKVKAGLYQGLNLLPLKKNTFNQLEFSFNGIRDAVLYRLEIEDPQGLNFYAYIETRTHGKIGNALKHSYTLPAVVSETLVQTSEQNALGKWRVQALSSSGGVLLESRWERFY